MIIPSFIVIAIFLGINIWILISDIYHRKIKNILLLSLLLILPFWYSVFPHWSRENTLLQIFFSLTLVIAGVFFYKKNWFLGSGDIKYAAILILFLGTQSIPLFIGNIWILTLFALGFWWSMILGQLVALHQHIELPSLKWDFTIQSFLVWLWWIIFDWMIIGIFLYLIIQDILLRIFQIFPSGGDIYFMVSLSIFVLRRAIRFIIIEWKYKAFPLFFLLIYFSKYIQENGIDSFVWENIAYITNIWKYAIVFMAVRIVTQKTFVYYNSTMEKIGSNNKLHTIPYSVIIFLWFFALFFLDIHLMWTIKNLL